MCSVVRVDDAKLMAESIAEEEEELLYNNKGFQRTHTHTTTWRHFKVNDEHTNH